MAIREIKIYPEPVLKKRTEPVLRVTDSEKRLIKDMEETLPLVDGIGLAAPQVGLSCRIAIAKDLDKDQTITLINPVILKRSGRSVGEEGCLSLPGLAVNLRRWRKIVVRYLNIDGKVVTIEADGLLARIIQHELDHLNGILIIDKLGFLSRRKAFARFAKK